MGARHISDGNGLDNKLVMKREWLKYAQDVEKVRPTYEEYLLSLKPPFKCVYDNKDWVCTDKDIEWTLTPCFVDNNNGESIKVPLGTILTHIYKLYDEL